MEPVQNNRSEQAANEAYEREQARRKEQQRAQGAGVFAKHVSPSAQAPARPVVPTSAGQASEGEAGVRKGEAGEGPAVKLPLGDGSGLCKSAAALLRQFQPPQVVQEQGSASGPQKEEDGVQRAKERGDLAEALAEAEDRPAPKITARKAEDQSSSSSSGQSNPSLLPSTPAAAPPAGSGRGLVIPPNVQQFIEYAAVVRNAQGVVEFRMGLSRGVMGGIGIRLSAYGQRRLGVRVLTGGNKGIIEEGDLQPLIEALGARGVEVVEVVVE